MHNLGYTLVAAALLTLAGIAQPLAALHPVAATGVAALAGALWLSLRKFRRFYWTRRRAGWTRTVCVPGTDVCLKL